MGAELPSPYTAGTVSITANTPTNLGQAVQQQIDANAALAAFQVNIETDSGNAQAVLFGMDGNVGTGSPVKYGRSMASGTARTYGGGTGNNILWGRWVVFSTANAVLHIEVFP